MRKEVKMAGFGGQGIVLMGVILAEAAGYYEDLEVAQTQSYGPEARGGACRAEVVLSDEIIDYTKTLNPDVFIAMSQPALDRYLPEIDSSHSQVFIDETLVATVPEKIRHLHRVPSTRLAEEKCGNRMVANIIMLGVVAKKTGLISIEALRSTLQERLSPKLREINLKALEAALSYEQERNAP
jgi:2-oxoglutarate ferredoxin oxidoreductase subunit gamma